MNRLRLRSALFVPGDRLSAMVKARTLPADAVIIGNYWYAKSATF